METQDVLVVLSLIVTAIVIIFVALLAVAGSLQTLFTDYIIAIMLLIGDVTEGILRSLLLSMIFGSLLGPPLSWGASLLGAVNPQWWLKTYLAWYIIVEIL